MNVIAEYLSFVQYFSVFAGMPSTWNQEERTQYRHFLQLKARIEMLLNLDNKAHAELFKIVHDLSFLPITERDDQEKRAKEFHELRIKVVALAHVIAKGQLKGIVH